MPPPRSPQVDAYSAAVEDVRSRVVAYGLAVWAATTIDDAGASALAAQMVGVVAAAQLRVAYLTALFLGRQTGTDPVPVVEEQVTGLRRGVDTCRVGTTGGSCAQAGCGRRAGDRPGCRKGAR
jgi:hypothetical protein